jgi:hypothetical protein
MDKSNWIPFYVVNQIIKQSPYSVNELKKYMFIVDWKEIQQGLAETSDTKFGESKTHVRQLPGRIDVYLNGYYEIIDIIQDRGTDSTGEEYPVYVTCLIHDNEFSHHKISDKKRYYLEQFITNEQVKDATIQYFDIEISPYELNPPIYCHRNDLKEFCKEEGIPDFDLKLIQYKSTPPPPPWPPVQTPVFPVEKVNNIDILKYEKLESELKSAKEKIVELEKLLKNQNSFTGKAHVINPMIKTIRALSLALIEDSSLPDDVPIATVRRILTHIDGCEGAPKTEKTLKRHLTTI